MNTPRRPPPTSPAARVLLASWRALGPLVLSGLILSSVGLSLGCRAISRYSESHQSIAARRLSRQGHEAMHAGQWDVAEGLFTSALELTAADDRAHWGLAESLWQRGEREAALKHMEAAVRLSASDPRLMRRLARMYLDLGRIADADRQSLAALQADRQAAEVWALRGDCLLAQGDQAAALAAYHRALALQPDYPDVQLQAAEIYRLQGRYDRLLATVDRLKDSLVSDAVCRSRAHTLRGIALQQFHRHSDAQRCFEEAIRGTPDDPEPYLYLAALHLEQGHPAAAREPLQTAIDLAPQSPRAIELATQVHGTQVNGTQVNGASDRQREADRMATSGQAASLER